MPLKFAVQPYLMLGAMLTACTATSPQQTDIPTEQSTLDGDEDTHRETDIRSDTGTGSDTASDTGSAEDDDADSNADSDKDVNTDSVGDSDTVAIVDSSSGEDTSQGTATVDTATHSDVETGADTATHSDVETGADTATHSDVEAGADTDTVDILREPQSHRSVGASCEGIFSAPDPYPEDSTSIDECTAHADCIDGINGKCVLSESKSYACCEYSCWDCYYACRYDECLTDEDCGDSGVCQCDRSAGARCLNAGNCRVDQDCGENGYCSLAQKAGMYMDMLLDVGYFCRTPEDTCVDDQDCWDDWTGDFCTYDPFVGHWGCEWDSHSILG